MKGIIKNVINSGNYKLEDMLNKIMEMYIRSYITEEDRTELEALAREKANTDQSMDIINKLKEMDLRIKECEAEIASLKENAESPEEPETTEEYPAYVPGKWYYNGDKSSENSKNYVCIAPIGQVCVWSPSQYPAYWQEVEV